MRIGSVVAWPEIGAELALCGDEEQAAFLNTFFSELRRQCGTYYRSEMQMAFVADKLSKEARELCEMLGPEKTP